MTVIAADYSAEQLRRFGGSARLLGDAGLARLRAAHIAVIGIGGVGSWAVEALARSGIGTLTLIDEDQVAESNINRQIHALDSTLGAAKVQAMGERLSQISDALIHSVESFVTPQNAADLIPVEADVIIDAIDQTSAKAAVIALARERQVPVFVCGAAGARLDPLKLTRGDLANTTGDALLASVRARLRRHHGFSREKGRRFGVSAIYSSEQPQGDAPASAGDFPLACAGYGSMMTVTATMGMAAAGDAIGVIAGRR